MITLKEHNIKPYEELCRMLETEDKVAYVSATGTGKSYVVGKYIDENVPYEKVLILAPTREIKRNWNKLLPGVKTFTYAALLSSPLILDEVEVLVCDEMHHLGANRWGKSYQNAISSFNGKIIGITATPVRYLDSYRDMVQELFEGNVVVGLELPEAITQRVLPSFDYVTAIYNKPEGKNREQTDTITEQLYRQLDMVRSKYAFQKILSTRLKGHRHKVAVFVNSVSEIEHIVELCKEEFPDADHYVVHSYLKDSEQKEALEGFVETKELSFIYTVNLLNEGLHIEGIDTVVMFRKTRSPIIYLQQIGRALTANRQKDRILIFDFVANHSKLGRHLKENVSVLQWVNQGISEKDRQVVVDDYTMEEVSLLKKLDAYRYGKWLPEEDDLIINLYDGGDGIPDLLRMLPQRTEQQIRRRASLLGIGGEKSTSFLQYQECIRKFYLEPNGIDEILKRFPDKNARAISAMANRMGIYRTVKGEEWSEKEIAVLYDNPELDIPELMKLLPNRSRVAINTRRRKLGLGKSIHKWTPEEDRILIEHTKLPLSKLKELYFPEMGISALYSRTKALGLNRSRVWDEEKHNRFMKLFEAGGYKAVLADAEFSDLSISKARDRVRRSKKRKIGENDA